MTVKQPRCYLVSPSLQVPNRHGQLEGHSEGDLSKKHLNQGELEDVVHDADMVLGDPIVGQWSDDPYSTSVRVLTTPKDMTAEEFARHCVTHIPYEPGCVYCAGGGAQAQLPA